jgi:hypothetical protein
MISEDDAEDYKQQNREEKRRAFLERKAMMGGPEAPAPCEQCDGNGQIVTDGCLCPAPVRDEDCYQECLRCLGTGVQR